MDDIIGGKLSSFKNANVGGIVILARCEFHFIKEHETLVQHPSNNISIDCVVFTRVGLDIRPFSIFGRIPDIETIWIPDIRMIFNAGYSVICRISNVGQIYGTGYPAI